MTKDIDILLQPKAHWETEEINDTASLVWWSRLDGRYQIEVHQATEDALHALGLNRGSDRVYQGILCIFDHDNDDELLMAEAVPLSYGAIFGPDVDDVAVWQERVIAFVDSK
jgi:hypothetical protein